MPKTATAVTIAAIGVVTAVVTPPAHAAVPVFGSTAPRLYTYFMPLRDGVTDRLAAVARAMAAVGVPYTPPPPPPGAVLITGATLTTRVLAVRVPRPKDGYRGGTGHTAVISAAGPNAGMASQAILANVRSLPPVDCGNNHGVHEP